MTNIVDRDAGVLVSKVTDHAKNDMGVTLGGKPYNQSDTARTAWWLLHRSKLSAWPAYDLGKFVIQRFPHELVIRVGLDIERGLGPEAASMVEAHGPRMLLRPDWRWHKFVADARAGRVQSILDSIELEGGKPCFDFHVGTEPLGSGRALHEPLGAFRFDSVAGRLRCVLAPDEPQRSKYVPGIDAAETVQAIVEQLDAIKNPWVWVGVCVGARFEFPPDDSMDGAWDSTKVWRVVLKPFWPWLD